MGHSYINSKQTLPQVTCDGLFYPSCDGPTLGTSDVARKRLVHMGHLEQGNYGKCVESKGE